jgi:hypothetical protein
MVLKKNSTKRSKWGKYFDMLNVKGQELNIQIFHIFLNRFSLSKICIKCARKVFKVSYLGKYTLKVTQCLSLQKLIFTQKDSFL